MDLETKARIQEKQDIFDTLDELSAEYDTDVLEEALAEYLDLLIMHKVG
jgi:hypothetical protein